MMLCWLLAACGGGGANSIGASSAGGGTATVPWTSLVGRTWTLPAASEGYVCTRIMVPKDLYITGFRTTANKVVRAMVTVSSSATVTGDYSCDGDSLDNALIYASGLGTGDFVFPTGFGIHVQAGQYLNLNLHIVNADIATVTDTAEIFVKAGIASDITTPAEMILLGTRSLNIPNNGNVSIASGGYYTTYEQKLLALLPLMQTYAIHQKVVLRRPGGTETILDIDFDPSIQFFYPLSPVSIHSGDGPLAECSYINNGPQAVIYGDSWDDETCFSAMYLAPSAGQTWSVGSP